MKKNTNKKQAVFLRSAFGIAVCVVFVVGIEIWFGLLFYKIFVHKNVFEVDNFEKDRSAVVKKFADNDYFGNNYIKIKFPRSEELIENPILISGKANVFEGNVRIRIKDKKGNILANTFITAEGAYDKLYPFKKYVNYNTPNSKTGTVEIFEESARNGEDANKIVIPIIFRYFKSS